MATKFTSAQVVAGADILAAQENAMRLDMLKNAGDYATSTGSSNAYVLALDAQITTYVAGDVFKFNANFANTAAATLNVNTIGAKTIKKNHDVDLESGDIEIGQLVTVMYDGTNLQLLSPTAIELSSAAKAVLGGGTTSNADPYHTHVGKPPQFDIVLDLAKPPVSSNTGRAQVALSPDLSFAFLAFESQVTEQIQVFRFALETNTGLYHYDNTTITLDKATYGWNGNPCGITVGDTYVWVAAGTGSVLKLVRMTHALASATLMTQSGTAYTSDIYSICGDDADIYGTAGGATVAHWTISGTTSTRTTDITLTSAANYGIIETDGTDFFLYDHSLHGIRKYPLAGGAVTSSTYREFGANSNDLGASGIGDETRFACIGLPPIGTTAYLYGVIYKPMQDSFGSLGILSFVKTTKP